MSKNYTPILLEITTKCKHCGDTIAINSAVKKIWCSGCHAEVLFSKELWSLLLGEILSISGEMSYGEARNTMFEDETAGMVRVSFKKLVYCAAIAKSRLTMVKMMILYVVNAER
jgi:hypothetical protein